MTAVVCLLLIPHADIRRKCQLNDGIVEALKDAVTASAVLAPHIRDEDKFQVCTPSMY